MNLIYTCAFFHIVFISLIVRSAHVLSISGLAYFYKPLPAYHVQVMLKQSHVKNSHVICPGVLQFDFSNLSLVLLHGERKSAQVGPCSTSLYIS